MKSKAISNLCAIRSQLYFTATAKRTVKFFNFMPKLKFIEFSELLATSFFDDLELLDLTTILAFISAVDAKLRSSPLIDVVLRIDDASRLAVAAALVGSYMVLRLALHPDEVACRLGPVTAQNIDQPGRGISCEQGLQSRLALRISYVADQASCGSV